MSHPTSPAAKTATAPEGGAAVSLRSLLEEMIERDASDLHITAGERAKLRVDGDICNSNIETVLSPKDTLQLAYSVLTENQKKSAPRWPRSPVAWCSSPAPPAPASRRRWRR
jgi:hypothetical protein